VARRVARRLARPFTRLPHSAIMSVLKVYYWPMLARGAPLVRMLDHTATAYEYFSDKDSMAALASTWGATGDTFAPPIVVDGDFVVSQSIASCLYLGKKLGLSPANEFKGTQYMLDIIDTFEGNLGKNNEQGPALKAFIEGSRFKALMGSIERGIKGPFYFGSEPCCVDFFLAAHLDWRTNQVFGPLKAKLGVDALAAFPKMVGILETLSATDAWKNCKLRQMGPLKDEILEAYNS